MPTIGELREQAQAFVTWAAALLQDAGSSPEARLSIAQRLASLRPPSVDGLDSELGSLHGSAAASTILARSPDGPVLMLGRFPADAPTPVHNHNSWGIVSVIAGRDRYLRWTRLDDGSDSRRASLRLVEERELEEGETAMIPDPPDDLHAQQGIGGPVWELVFFGSDPDAAPRAYFDVDSGTVSFAPGAR